MRILYISSAITNKKYEQLYSGVDKKPANTASKFNRLIAEGILESDNNANVTMLSKPVINKSTYKKAFYKGDREKVDRLQYVYTPVINLKILNHLFSFLYTFIYCLIFSIKNKESILMVDVLNISTGLGATIAYKIRGLKSVGIVTDLPKYYGNEIVQNVIQKVINNCKMHILLTESMKEVIAPNDKPYIVIEGVADSQFNLPNNLNEKYSKKVILYAGSLNKKYGIIKFVNSFKNVINSEARLWIFGTGDGEGEILNAIQNDDRIYFGGMRLNTEILEMETKATLLINPRPSSEELTKYSFPSKTLEYMTTGTPVLTTKLEGIPPEYDDYLFQFDDESEGGFEKKISEMLEKPAGELHAKGLKAKEFVLKNKNNKIHGKKIINFMKKEAKDSWVPVYNLVENKCLNVILQYLIVFLSIVLSRDTLVTRLRFNFNLSTFIFGIFMLVIVVLLFLNNKTILKIHKKTPHFIIFLGTILVPTLIKLDFQLYILSIVFYIGVAYLFIHVFTFKTFLKIMSNVMIFLAIFSLLGTYAIRPLLFRHGMINQSFSLVVNSVGLEFFDLGLTYVVAQSTYFRNFGLFREPGVYQFFLLLPLLYEVLVKAKKMSYIKVGILSITMLSTMSPTGIMCMIMIFTVYGIEMIRNGEFTKKVRRNLFLSVIVFLGIVMIPYSFNYHFRNTVNARLMVVSTYNQSSSARLVSVTRDINYFFLSPIWGNMFNRIVTEETENTNSIFSIFAIFGVLAGTLMIKMWWTFTRYISKNLISRILILGSFLIAISSQFLLGNVIFWVIVFSQYMKKEDMDTNHYDEEEDEL